MQESYAIASHAKAIDSRKRLQQEIVAVAAIEDDVFSRHLSARLCSRLPALAGDTDHALTSATTAVEADAAAAVLLIGEEFLDKLPDSADTGPDLCGGCLWRRQRDAGSWTCCGREPGS